MENQRRRPEGSAWSALLTVVQQPTLADCARCLTQLDAYVTAQLAADAATELLAETAAHLDSCLECAQVYALLYEARLAETQQAMAVPPQIPPPDLSFLPTRGNETAVSLVTQLRQQIQQAADKIHFQVTGALLPWLQPLPQAAPVRQAAEARYADILLCLTPEHAPALALPFTLLAFRDTQKPDLCLVEVVVEPPGVSWPDLGGRMVTITAAAQQWTQETDDWGTAVFADMPIIALETIRVEIALNR